MDYNELEFIFLVPVCPPERTDCSPNSALGTTEADDCQVVVGGAALRTASSKGICHESER